ncbi:N-lysine methyltransferase SETD6 isoform X3 [Callithrix jacchus]|uniref:N-lysine methyltransferase SETD6 isoform X3 n=1 Tax=Callithrix jacchus TaxID=9483 RepID=UPI00159D3B1A|nr:N-lysine methyltransferase SETD6 isoform X3 [Callithrix jacchus]
MFSGGTIPAGANPGQCTAQTPKQAPRGSGAGAGPETPEVTALPTGPRGGSSSDHGDPGEAPTARSAHAPRSPLVLSGPSAVGPGHCAHLSQMAEPIACGDQDPVAGFLSWCRRVGLELSPKVEVSRQGTVAGYGMVARESVQAGELLFVVPRAAILSQYTCSIGGLLERERGALQSQSGWVPLLLALLHELQAPASHWRPYFALWPELGHLKHPMFCFQEPLEEEEDEKEPNSPVMVPAADILNHLANHNANLEYSADCLRMVATQPIPKGHEIFNTYGQMANWQLIHMYGFVEPYPDNTDDTADIQMVIVREAALQGTKTEAERLLLYERWDFLCKLEMVGEEGAFVIGREEVLTEEELTTTLKVLCMPAEEFREFKDQDGGGDDKREEGSLTVTNIPKLKASWRQLLRNSILLTLQTYATDLKTDKDVLSNKEVYAKLSWREQQALQVRYGQKMILHQLLELTN